VRVHEEGEEVKKRTGLTPDQQAGVAAVLASLSKPLPKVPVALFVQVDGALRSATAGEVGLWLAEDEERQRLAREMRNRTELARWPEARPGWHRTHSGGWSNAVTDIQYTYGSHEDAPWVLGFLARNQDPESWWIEAWNPSRLGARARRGPFPDFERACVAVETGGPPLPWPPEPRLPDDPRVSDTMRCLDIAKQWQQLALRLHGALTPFREVAGIREVWSELWLGESK
jgi:hypothetical protein